MGSYRKKVTHLGRACRCKRLLRQFARHLVVGGAYSLAHQRDRRRRAAQFVYTKAEQQRGGVWVTT
ncbi:hypothetical protein HC891_15500 [Candidatus Gracilibacteria bacterium]|nr:hypothetical protein [Candidatus Gracilibacteria bacterium]